MITVIHTLCLESLRFQPGQKIGNHHNGAINQSVDTRLVSSIDDTPEDFGLTRFLSI